MKPRAVHFQQVSVSLLPPLTQHLGLVGDARLGSRRNFGTRQIYYLIVWWVNRVWECLLACYYSAGWNPLLHDFILSGVAPDLLPR